MQWKGLDLDTLKDSAKAQLQEIKGLHRCTQWFDAFTTLAKICKDFLATIPLIVLLGSKSMRPRHWMSLIQVTGTKNSVSPCDNEAAPLGNVLTIDLLKFSNGLEEICDMASKEDKMETSSTWKDSRASSSSLDASGSASCSMKVALSTNLRVYKNNSISAKRRLPNFSMVEAGSFHATTLSARLICLISSPTHIS